MIKDPGRVRRLFVLGAGAVALLAIVSGSVALAGNGQSAPPTPVVAETTAPAAGQTDVKDAADAAVQALVEDGTISQEQADVLRQQIDAGSIDEQRLVDSGVLTAAQMEAVQIRLTAVKQSFAAGAGSMAPSASSSTSKAAQQDPSKTN
jgi:hypothetical protein